jgi:hypothetical protein
MMYPVRGTVHLLAVTDRHVSSVCHDILLTAVLGHGIVCEPALRNEVVDHDKLICIDTVEGRAGAFFLGASTTT